MRPRQRQAARATVPPMLERDFYAPIRELAQLAGWIVFHTHDSRGSDPGFPDFCFVRERVVFAEVKGPKTEVTPAQLVWHHRLVQAGAEAYIWRMPTDMPVADRVLGRRERSAA